MQIHEINSQPCDVKDILPRARMNGANKERTAGFVVVFNYSANILDMLSMDGQAWKLPGLWDGEGSPQTGIKDVRFNREFEHYKLVFARNNKAVLTFVAEKLHSWTVKPQKVEMFEVTFKALGVCSEGDTERLHKLVKDPGITLAIQVAEGNQVES